MRWSCRLIGFAVLAVAASPVLAAGHAPAACSVSVYRQFDFFAGDWDTYDVQAPAKVVARNTVKVILDGCVLHEDYRQDDGLHGESYSLYDAARKVWHQSWVTNHGDLLLLDGGMQGNRMVGPPEGQDLGGPAHALAVRGAAAARGSAVAPDRLGSATADRSSPPPSRIEPAGSR